MASYGSELKKPQNGERHRVNRKAVSSQRSNYTSKSENEKAVDVNSRNPAMEMPSELDLKEVTPPLPPRPGLSLQTSIPASDSTTYFTPTRSATGASATSISTPPSYGLPSTKSFPISLSATSTGTADSITSQSSSSSRMKKAYEEARHFAGGLIQRPCESTKHFTILRHSHGLVFYQGSSTTLAISIFSDEPLPPDRTLWLQSKGWTGKTGMRVETIMGRTGGWIDVTPTLAVGSEQVNPNDERAWQRDFQKFQKKGPSKVRDRHQLRETAVVRIPAEAGDGYFQLVLCSPDKKKIYCKSPPFRVLSTSMSPSSIKGASLATLPLELGAMVLTTYGKSTAGVAASVIASPFQSKVQQYMPSFWTREAASAVYQVSGAQERIGSTARDAQSQYDQTIEESFAVAEKEELALEEGPKAPYPICFIAGYEASTLQLDQFNLPHINLSVPSSVWTRLYGHYLTWVRVLPAQQKAPTQSLPTEENPWMQAILSATPLDPSKLPLITVADTRKKQFALHIIQELAADDELESLNLISASDACEIRIMAFLRPDEPAQRQHIESGLRAGDEAAEEAAMLVQVKDIATVQVVLDHPAWAVDGVEREGEGGGEGDQGEREVGWSV